MVFSDLESVIRYLLPGFAIVLLVATKHWPNIWGEMNGSSLFAIVASGILAGMMLDTMQRLLALLVEFARRCEFTKRFIIRRLRLALLSWGYLNLLPICFKTDYVSVYMVWSSLPQPAFSYLRARDDLANFMIKMTLILLFFLVGEGIYHIVVLNFSLSDGLWLLSAVLIMSLFYLMASMRLRIAIGISYVLTEIHLRGTRPVNFSRVFPAGVVEKVEWRIIRAYFRKSR